MDAERHVEDGAMATPLTKAPSSLNTELTPLTH
jgi:hypothetical protein